MKVKGKIFKNVQTIKVRIPNSIQLMVCGTWIENGLRQTLVQAVSSPSVTFGVAAYKWKAEYGAIVPCGGYAPGEATERSAFLELNNLNPDNLIIDPTELSTSLLETLSNGKNPDSLLIQKVASYNSSKAEYLLIGVSEKNQINSEEEIERDHYIIYPQSLSEIPPIFPIDPPGDLRPAIPWGNPSYAIVTSGNINDCKVTCNLITPCKGTLTATKYITGNYSYSTSYSLPTNSIRISREEEGIIQDDDYTYKANIYSDFGLVKVVSFNSSEKLINIPLDDLPTGNYYLNIVDHNGKVIERKTIPISK